MQAFAVILLLIITNAALIALLFILATKPSPQPNPILKKCMNRPYAHRGLYDMGMGIPENSLAAFKLAAEAERLVIS